MLTKAFKELQFFFFQQDCVSCDAGRVLKNHKLPLVFNCVRLRKLKEHFQRTCKKNIANFPKTRPEVVENSKISQFPFEKFH